MKEGSGVAANVLKNLGVDLRQIRLEVERIVTASQNGAILDRPTWTPKAKKAIEHSIQAARDLKHGYVGTEHLLLGLLRDPDPIAGRVLSGLGLTADLVRAEITRVLLLDVEPEADTPQVVQ